MFMKSQNRFALRNRRRSRQTVFRLESLESRALLAGDLDATFSGDGWVTTDFGTTGDVARAVAIQTDGKIVVAGDPKGATTGNDFAVARYNNDGTLDTSFGVGGKLTTDFGQAQENAFGVVIQPDGKIVVAGRATVLRGKGSKAALDWDFAVARYNSNGTLDTSFGQPSGGQRTGKMLINFGLEEQAFGVALQSDGKIVVSGKQFSDDPNYDNRIATARLNTNGTLDTSFDGDGLVTTNVSVRIAGVQSGDDFAKAVAVQSDGRIVVAGGTNGGSASSLGDFAVVRYNANGSLDPSFDTDGIKVIAGESGGGDEARALAIQSDGRIVIAGRSGDDVGLARLNGSDGSPDPTFDGDGVVRDDWGGEDDGQGINGSDAINGLALQADGKLVAAGQTVSGVGGGANYQAVARYTTDGALDTSFAGSGLVFTDVPGDGESAQAVAFDASQRIVTAGAADTNFFVARYLGDSPLVASATGPGAPVGALLTTSALGSIRAAAIARWTAVGADARMLAGVQFAIANLPGNLLGLASGNTITLDRDAAGWGWFVDPTPRDDYEFVLAGNQGERNRMDLLTAVMHEMGHVLGLDHDEHGDDVMYETLAAGVRRTGHEHDGGASTDHVLGQSGDNRADGWLGLWLTEQFESTNPRAKRRR